MRFNWAATRPRGPVHSLWHAESRVLSDSPQPCVGLAHVRRARLGRMLGSTLGFWRHLDHRGPARAGEQRPWNTGRPRHWSWCRWLLRASACGAKGALAGNGRDRHFQCWRHLRLATQRAGHHRIFLVEADMGRGLSLLSCLFHAMLPVPVVHPVRVVHTEHVLYTLLEPVVKCEVRVLEQPPHLTIHLAAPGQSCIHRGPIQQACARDRQWTVVLECFCLAKRLHFLAESLGQLLENTTPNVCRLL
mmetsp:Transcript_18755/g.35200  ORF Transcript_18755/g.35200 Transcript_18755/m.35200 type:complete len:247 (-) Transcript_18755:186-926(-)